MACEVFADPGEKAQYRNGVMQGVFKTLSVADELVSIADRRSEELSCLSVLQRGLVLQALQQVLDSCERFNQLRSGPASGFTAGLAQAESYGALNLDSPEGWEVLAGVDAARERAAFTFDPVQVAASCTNNNLLIEKLLLLQTALTHMWGAS